MIAWLRPPRATLPPSGEADDNNPESGGWSLRFRFLATVLIALAPVALVSVVQGLDRVKRDEADIRERLIQTARASAGEEENMLAAAEQILRALANQPVVRSGGAGCNKALADALSGLSFFTNITRIDAKGRVICSALEQGKDLDVRTLSWWREATQQEGFAVHAKLYGVLSKRDVVMGLLPLRTSQNRFDGALTIGIDTQWLDFMLRAKQLPEGSIVSVFDRLGNVIAANKEEVAAAIFGNQTEHRREPSGLFSTTGPKGETWLYATAPLLSNQIFVGIAMREADLFAWTYVHVATDLLLPVFMLGLASLAIWVATERQVIRWIVYMRRIASAYARGHYAIRPVALEDAPKEFRALGETFSSMAEAIQDRDKNLRDAVEQKTILIKETHHRIKNNLQIVMSLLSLQSGRLRDPAAQDALKQAQARVNALALVHHILHELEDQSTVDIKRLLTDLVEQLHGGLGGDRRDLNLKLDIVARYTSSDIAVPLTLFAVEALTNVFKHAYPPAHRGGTIEVTLQPTANGQLRLAISDDGEGVDVAAMQAGIGSRLINAFAQQIGGTASITPNARNGTTVELRFPDPEASKTVTFGKPQRSGSATT